MKNMMIWALAIFGGVFMMGHSVEAYCDVVYERPVSKLYLAGIKLRAGKAPLGKKAYKKKCSSCHVTATRFVGYKASKISKALRTQPTMTGLKVAPQEMVDLVVYLKKP